MPARPWDPEVSVDEALVRALLASQFPELGPSPALQSLGVGFDNAAWLVDERWVFRFPRRTLGAELLAVENAVLPSLARRLPLPVPDPVHVGVPEGDYPFPFAGYAILPGATACRVTMDEAGRARNAAPLGRWLAALHAFPAPDGLGGDRLARAHLPRLRDVVIERLPEIGARERIDTDAILARLDRHVDAPAGAAPVVIHGDLYPRHLLVDDGAISGVIDWGDVHRGDPAHDLSIAWTFLPRAAHGAFRDAYGPIDDTTWVRARFIALWYGVVLLHYGLEAGDEGMARIGRRAITAAV